jgi:hypothetical protein
MWRRKTLVQENTKTSKNGGDEDKIDLSLQTNLAQYQIRATSIDPDLA